VCIQIGQLAKILIGAECGLDRVPNAYVPNLQVFKVDYVFTSCGDNDTVIVFTTGRLLDVNSP
jgi:hypothetical protein